MLGFIPDPCHAEFVLQYKKYFCVFFIFSQHLDDRGSCLSCITNIMVAYDWATQEARA